MPDLLPITMESGGCQLSHSFDTVSVVAPSCTTLGGRPPCTPSLGHCSNQCSTRGRERCNTLAREHCSTLGRERCNTLGRDRCNTLARERCNTLGRASCATTLRRRGGETPCSHSLEEGALHREQCGGVREQYRAESRELANLPSPPAWDTLHTPRGRRARNSQDWRWALLSTILRRNYP